MKIFDFSRFSIALALAATNPVSAAEMEPLTGDSPAEVSLDGTVCTQDKQWCVRLETDKSALFFQRFFHDEGHRQVWDGRVVLPAREGDTPMAHTDLWDKAIRIAEQEIVVGVLHTQEAFYSGGKASAQQLSLIDINLDDREPGIAVLDVSVGSDISIKACFAAEDIEKRKDACHDQYRFAGNLALAPDDGRSRALPDLVYTTEAFSYPGPVSRDADSSIAPPLSAEDLVEVRNDRCSFQRNFRYDLMSESYQPSTPLPDCSDYTSP